MSNKRDHSDDEEPAELAMDTKDAPVGDQDYSFVTPNLIISGITAAMDKALITRLAITHMVTVDIGPLIPQPLANYFYIDAMDDVEEDLLSYFPQAIQFIESALEPKTANSTTTPNTNRVLVHCNRGSSRSATIVLAFLMVTKSWTYKEAFLFLVSKRETVDPNEGFRDQLVLFEEMGFKLDLSNLKYRRLMLANLRFKIRHAKEIPIGRSPDLPKRVDGDDITEHRHRHDYCCKYFAKLRSGVAPEHLNNMTTYKCKKCRLFLFKEINVLTNEEPSTKPGTGGDGVMVEDVAMSEEEQEEVSNHCEALFVEPLEWMLPSMATQGGDNGIISCPHCMAKLGGFEWMAALKCYTRDMKECLRHKGIAPSFKLDWRKIDVHPHTV